MIVDQNKATTIKPHTLIRYDGGPMKRRTFLKSSLAITAINSWTLNTFGNISSRPTIILRSGWQNVNIGDITHTPGVVRVIKKYIPEANVILWPAGIDKEVETLLLKNLPDLKIVYGQTDSQGKPIESELQKAFDEADLLMHGSGAGIYLERPFRYWRDHYGKPYGVYGVTVSQITEGLHNILSTMDFIFCRETHSVKNVHEAGIKHDRVDFAPDGTFAILMRDDEKANTYMQDHALEDKRFICIVPRLRYTPYHTFRKTNWTEEMIRQKTEVNEKYQEQDHAKLRHVIVEWVRNTGMKVLVCPEMTYQLDIIHPLVVDPLPDDVKKHVVARETFWLPDEAASIYKRAHTIISMECHSPIIALAHGTPAFYVRQPEDTIKGQMYYDIGLEDWVFEIDETQGNDIYTELMTVHRDYDQALQKRNHAMEQVAEHHQNTMLSVRNMLGL